MKNVNKFCNSWDTDISRETVRSHLPRRSVEGRARARVCVCVCECVQFLVTWFRVFGLV
jgi:hypothetical protein